MQMDGDAKFWARDPCVLATDLELFPTAQMSKDRKLNALTRLAILLAAVMAFFHQSNWALFLLAALLAIVLLGYGMREPFTRTPTYADTDFHQTIVSPTYAEEWQIPPPAYDLYDSYPEPEPLEDPLKPQSYPYGQYRTVTNNLLPADSYLVDQLDGGVQRARELTNNLWTRQSLAFRDNMTRVYKKKLNRRFRHNCADTWSPYQSY